MLGRYTSRSWICSLTFWIRILVERSGANKPNIGTLLDLVLDCSRTEWVYLPILFSRPSSGAVVQTTKEWGQHGLRASPDQRYWSRAPVIVGSNPTRPT